MLSRLRPVALLLAATLAAGQAKTLGEDKEAAVDGRTLSEWAALLDSPEVVERQGAVLALGKLGPPAVPHLAKALSDKKVVNCRLWAAGGLRKIGPEAKAAVPQLEAALNDELGMVRMEAARALWAISEHKAAIPALIKLLTDKEAYNRGGAARTLGGLGPKAKSALPALRAGLSDTGSWETVHPGGPMGTLKKISFSVSDAAAAAIKRIESDGGKKPAGPRDGATAGEITEKKKK